MRTSRPIPVHLLALVLEIVRFWLLAPDLRSVETVTASPAYLRFATAVRRTLIRPRVHRLVQRASRFLPTPIIYRGIVLPAAIAVIARNSVRAVRANSGRLRKQGVSATKQFALILRSCLRYPGMVPVEFYLYSLHRAESRRFAAHAAHNDQILLVMALAGARGGTPSASPYESMNDKLAYWRICRESDLPTPHVIAGFTNGLVQWTDTDARLPSGDLFVKPVVGQGGIGAARVFYEAEADRYRLETPAAPLALLGQRVSYASGVFRPDELIEHLRSLAETVPLLLQPRLRTHRDLATLVGHDTLSCLRVISVIGQTGAPRVIGAYLKSATQDTSIDNVRGGGVAAEVDLETGRLTHRIAFGNDQEHIERHPCSGMAIEGFAVPHLHDGLRLAVRGHEVFAAAEVYTLPVVGWDIAITGDGPVLIEGNVGADLRCQMTSRRPFWEDEQFRRCVLSQLHPVAGTRFPLLDQARPLSEIAGRHQPVRSPDPVRGPRSASELSSSRP